MKIAIIVTNLEHIISCAKETAEPEKSYNTELEKIENVKMYTLEKTVYDSICELNNLPKGGKVATK